MKNDSEETLRASKHRHPSNYLLMQVYFLLSSEALTYMKPSVTEDHRKGVSAFILPSQRLAYVIPHA